LGGNPNWTERHRIDKADMPPNQLGKGFFRALLVIILHQFHVTHIKHLLIYGRWAGNQAFILARSCKFFQPPRV
jgi:hypothetical protein